jgi:predicted LPLAT superfamily acyltransferase
MLPMPEAPAGQDRVTQMLLWQQEYVKRVEHYCKLHPYNWFNFYDFWQAA